MDNIIVNSIITPDGTVLESRHKHDFNCHEDANGLIYHVDGGRAYLRRLVEFKPTYDILSDTEVNYIKDNNISYDIQTGRFSSINGYIDNTIVDGYRQVYLGSCGDRNQYPAHRLIFYFLGTDIKGMEIDHINNIRHDNRFMNLRIVTRFQNQHNSEVSKLYTENSLFDTDDFEIIRERFERGGRGKNGDEPLTYVKLCDMNCAWLQATIEYICGSSIPPSHLIDVDSPDYRPLLALYVKEQIYRKERNITIN